LTIEVDSAWSKKGKKWKWQVASKTEQQATMKVQVGSCKDEMMRCKVEGKTTARVIRRTPGTVLGRAGPLLSQAFVSQFAILVTTKERSSSTRKPCASSLQRTDTWGCPATRSSVCLHLSLRAASRKLRSALKYLTSPAVLPWASSYPLTRATSSSSPCSTTAEVSSQSLPHFPVSAPVSPD